MKLFPVVCSCCIIAPMLQAGGSWGRVSRPRPRPERPVEVAAPSEIAEDVHIPEGVPRVQLAVLLDTSTSMDGMINQAKNQLWAIINEFITANRDGVQPRLEVALYHYGSPSLEADNGYIRQLMPFTQDLDRISQELFRLGTEGGSEYCGWVIQTSIDELKWSENPEDYKAIFIAGNESFAQGQVRYQKACKQAAEKGVIVNTIHCSGGSSEGWKQAALLADGQALKIDTNRVVVEIETPFDAEIAKLGTDINKTYLAYGGAKGQEAQQRQEDMDANSRRLGWSNFSKRARTKGSGYYNNASWDLVDARNQKQLKLEELKKEDLPKEMRDMTMEEREAYVDQKAKERVEIQKRIAELSVKREAFVAEKQAELAGNDDTLGNQVRKTVRKQAEAAGFSF